MSSSQAALVVGLGGVTNGGKTTMCDSLKRLFSSDKYNLRVQSLHMDDYFRLEDDPHHIHLDEFNHHDWDCLNALDTDHFIADLQSTRLKCDILLVEGFLIYNVPSSSKDKHLFDLAYYFDLPYEECRKRRLERNYDPPDPHGYFEGHVWEAYVKAREEAFEINQNMKLELVNTTEEPFEKIEEKIIKDIETSLKHVGKMASS
jgi:nicotinamide/nicotinate riboside kinase